MLPMALLNWQMAMTFFPGVGFLFLNTTLVEKEAEGLEGTELNSHFP